ETQNCPGCGDAALGAVPQDLAAEIQHRWANCRPRSGAYCHSSFYHRLSHSRLLATLSGVTKRVTPKSCAIMLQCTTASSTQLAIELIQLLDSTLNPLFIFCGRGTY